MHRLTAALEFIDRTRSQTTLQDLSQTFQTWLSTQGFACFCAGEIYAPQKMHMRGAVWAGSDHAWFKHWQAKGYARVDPLVWYLRRNQAVMRWSHLLELKDCPRREIFREARDFGILEGLGFSTRLDRDRVAVLSLGAELDIAPEDQVSVNLTSTYYIARAAQLKTAKTRKALLTLRERECLQWVAQGKRDADIADRLLISEATAKQHVNSAIHKLGACTRSQAVAIAIATREIQI